MKRLSWLLLAVFCAALAQVPLVDGLMVKAKHCGCCHPGACGMPGCCAPPASSSTAANSEQPARVMSLPAVRQTQPGRGSAEKFYASFVEPAAVRPALVASAEAAPAASVPLFRAHCSFLI
jgi:hypothetical protein